MKSQEFIIENLEEDLPPSFVNKVVDRSQWGAPGPKPRKNPPKGATASVWQHIADPHTVVKLVGGGQDKADTSIRRASIAFVDFLVHHGYKSKHLPIVHGINMDDPEVVQIRMETLRELPNRVCGYLEWLAFGEGAKTANMLAAELDRTTLSKQNDVKDIVATIKLLKSFLPEYKNKYKIRNFQLDLHSGNWMKRADGTIVAVDPWFAYDK